MKKFIISRFAAVVMLSMLPGCAATNLAGSVLKVPVEMARTVFGSPELVMPCSYDASRCAPSDAACRAEEEDSYQTCLENRRLLAREQQQTRDMIAQMIRGY